MSPVLLKSPVLYWITVLTFLFGVCSAAPSVNANKLKCEDVIKDSNRLLVDLIGPIYNRDNHHYAQFMPNSEQMLKKIDVEHGTIVTEPVDCSVSASKSKMRDSALCASHSIMNINHHRIPAQLVETTCTCSAPNHSLYPFLKDHLRCVPMEYLIKVYMYDEKCEHREVRFEKLSMGCKAVYLNTVTSSTEITEQGEESVEVPM